MRLYGRVPGAIFLHTKLGVVCEETVDFRTFLKADFFHVDKDIGLQSAVQGISSRKFKVK